MKRHRILLVLAAMALCLTACKKDDPVVPDQPSTPEDPVTPTATVGHFSVAEGRQVAFSSGNVQYCPATRAWRFAPNQYDAIGEANVAADESYDGWVDLFAFGTGNRPMFRSTDCGDFDVFADWGDNFEGGWRTLTEDEMEYLLLNRPRHDSLCVPATVCGMEGVILLPDDWSSPALNPMCWNSKFASNSYDAEEWATIELAGAIFLPAAGKITDGLGDFRSLGCYWTASTPSPSSSFSPSIYLSETRVWRQSDRRSLLLSVRLAKDLAQ